jgi:TPR repeat protein
MYRDGRGVTQDYAAAMSWFRKAADQANVFAQEKLGTMYYVGQGVPRDYSGAIDLVSKGGRPG